MRTRPNVNIVSTDYHLKLVILRFKDLYKSAYIQRKMLEKYHSEHIHNIKISLHSKTKYDSRWISWWSHNFLDRSIKQILRRTSNTSSISKIPKSQNVVFMNCNPQIFWRVENMRSRGMNYRKVYQVSCLFLHVNCWNHQQLWMQLKVVIRWELLR